ncbi:hypothetical protein GCM10027299_42130 [Larkinella ripae]
MSKVEKNPNDQPQPGSSGSEPYLLTQGEEGYLFTTDEGIRYNLRIAFQEGYYAQTPFADDVYEVSLLSEIKGNVGQQDPRIEATLLATLVNAFEDNPSLVLVYVCSEADDQEQTRSRLFRRWFRKYDTQYRMLEFNREEKRQFAAVIFRKDHPFAKEISTLFAETDRNK